MQCRALLGFHLNISWHHTPSHVESKNSTEAVSRFDSLVRPAGLAHDHQVFKNMQIRHIVGPGIDQQAQGGCVLAAVC